MTTETLKSLWEKKMIHDRDDYGRFQDPALANPSMLPSGATPIAQDEPVMLFRAQDENFISVLEAYRDMVWDKNRAIADKINAHIDLARQWQKTHQTKIPDLHEEGKR